MEGTFKLYNYNPSYVAAIIFTIIFLLSTALHLWQLLRLKTRFFTPFIIGGLFEACGYAARAINAKQTPNWSVGAYSGQSLLLLLAPSLYAASVYMILGRIIRVTDGGPLSPIKPERLTKVFVTGDVLSFLIQSGGGAILAQAKNKSKLNLGENLIVVGLIVQIIFFGVFILVSVTFHKRIRRSPTERSFTVEILWNKYMIVLYTASVFIMVRSVYRVVEYVQGSSGFLQRHEVFLYVFDSALMSLVSVLFNVFHPSLIIPGKENGEDQVEMLDWYKRVPGGGV